MTDSRRFSCDDIHSDHMETDLVRSNERLFFIVVAASFIESGTEK